jgi:hypothetical protein
MGANYASMGLWEPTSNGASGDEAAAIAGMGRAEFFDLAASRNVGIRLRGQLGRVESKPVHAKAEVPSRICWKSDDTAAQLMTFYAVSDSRVWTRRSVRICASCRYSSAVSASPRALSTEQVQHRPYPERRFDATT